jgi:hypothetical protein
LHFPNIKNNVIPCVILIYFNLFILFVRDGTKVMPPFFLRKCNCNNNEIHMGVLQSRGREFYNSGIQCLAQHWQKYAENDIDFVEE